MDRFPLYEVGKIKDIKDMLNQSVDKFSEKPAFLVKEKGEYVPISYRQFGDDAAALGTWLLERGHSGARVGVVGENSYEWALSYMATVCAAAVIVPIDKELPTEELDNIIKVSELDIIFYSPKYAHAEHLQKSPIAQKFNMKDDIPALLAEGRQLIAEGSRKYFDTTPDPEKMSILLFTSGTTGTAKGVMLNHRAIAVNLMAMCSMLYIGERDTFLSVLPLHHTYECTCGFLCQIYRGCTIAYCEGLRHIAKNLKESRATMMLAVPLMIEGMYKKIWAQAQKAKRDKKLRFALGLSKFLKAIGIDVSRKLFKEIHENLGGNLRMIVSGAAKIDPSVAEGMRAMGIIVVQGYGLTECSPIAALNRDVWFKDDAAGLPLPGVEIEIVEKDEEGIGEIAIKGGNLMLGYYENEAETAAVMSDGWFYSGDLGYKDKDGFIHITGRKKNVIVTKNGKNIFPEEIETYLGRSPYVAECMVAGKPLDDGDIKITAQIFPNFEAVEAELGKEYTKEALYKLLKSAVAEVNAKTQNYKRIAEFVIRDDEFIKTTSRKIKRHAVENR